MSHQQQQTPNYGMYSPNDSINAKDRQNLLNTEQLFSSNRQIPPIQSHTQLPQMHQFNPQLQVSSQNQTLHQTASSSQFKSPQNFTAPLNPNQIPQIMPNNTTIPPQPVPDWNHVKMELDMHLKTRSSPFMLVRDRILNIDPTFKNVIDKDPTFELMAMKMKEFKKYARIKYHTLQQDGSYKKPEIANPTGYSDIMEQQRIITEYECRRAKIIAQTENETRNRVSQIIHNFSSLLGENLATMTVLELKSELHKYKLKKTGPKFSMVQRMIQFFENSSKDLLENYLEKDFSMMSSMSSFSATDFSSVQSLPNTEKTQSELLAQVENYEQEQHMGDGLGDEEDWDFLNKVFFCKPFQETTDAEPQNNVKKMTVLELVESFEANNSS